ncbi:unnamed protein product [Onchocerca flexuosa]|uniref:50S ribosomal protein L23 n=1 Tax=Onchocerca flexuosa TaxID=387005 RepID=A0A183HLU9_9BILA|nr:unnamed protein product [Onchocerca flexuosa]
MTGNQVIVTDDNFSSIGKLTGSTNAAPNAKIMLLADQKYRKYARRVNQKDIEERKSGICIVYCLDLSQNPHKHCY